MNKTTLRAAVKLLIASLAYLRWEGLSAASCWKDASALVAAAEEDAPDLFDLGGPPVPEEVPSPTGGWRPGQGRR